MVFCIMCSPLNSAVDKTNGQNPTPAAANCTNKLRRVWQKVSLWLFILGADHHRTGKVLVLKQKGLFRHKKSHLDFSKWLISLLYTGGAGGSRTRVRKHSIVSSTYLVMSFGFNSRPRRPTGLERTSYLRFNLCPSNPSKSDPILMTLRIVFRRPTRWAL